SLPRGTAGAIALVGREGTAANGPVHVAITRLRHGGTGVVKLPDPGRYARITAVLVNADPSSRGWSHSAADWIFERDGQSIYARVSNRFEPLRLRSTSPAPNARRVPSNASVVLGFSAPVSRESLAAFRLRDSHGRRVKVSVRRSRGGRRVTLVPRSRLGSGARYVVQLGSGVVDTDANDLAVGPHSWKFRTRRG
ncbi:MAG: Bacterial Ig-like domain, partial [Thermoleophilaceae bacterium]|nr:Bacterial Ig-like domain [Thermoleophilaceae bacterium]